MAERTFICVTRHGETDWNITGILQGWIDVPLNDTGRRQALELAGSLGGYGFSRVCTSPLRRSAETAEIITEAWGMPPPTAYDGLKERNFGLIQGQPKAELSVAHPGLYQEIVRRNPSCHFDEGESADHFADRVMDALREIGRQNPGSRVLVITHGWVMDVITREIQNLPRTAVLDLKRKNGESIWLQMDISSVLSECDGTPDQ